MADPAVDHQQRFTYGDYLKWPEDERWELIDGVAYNMTPAPSTLHQRIVLELGSQLREKLKDAKCEPFIAPFDVRLPRAGESDEETETVVQPDLLVNYDQARIDKRGCLGAPDFIVEVTSPSTALKDQLTKTELYERHKVREYWILHPFDQLLIIRVLGDDGRYPAPRISKLEGVMAVTAVGGLEVDLDPVGELCAAEAAKDQEQESPLKERRI